MESFRIWRKFSYQLESRVAIPLDMGDTAECCMLLLLKNTLQTVSMEQILTKMTSMAGGQRNGINGIQPTTCLRIVRFF